MCLPCCCPSCGKEGCCHCCHCCRKFDCFSCSACKVFLSLLAIAAAVIVVSIAAVFLSANLTVKSWHACRCKNIDKSGVDMASISKLACAEVKCEAMCAGVTYNAELRYPPPPESVNIATGNSVKEWVDTLPSDCNCYMEPGSIVPPAPSPFDNTTIGRPFIRGVIEPPSLDFPVLGILIAGLVAVCMCTMWIFWIRTCCLKLQLHAAHAVTVA